MTIPNDCKTGDELWLQAHDGSGVTVVVIIPPDQTEPYTVEVSMAACVLLDAANSATADSPDAVYLGGKWVSSRALRAYSLRLDRFPWTIYRSRLAGCLAIQRCRRGMRSIASWGRGPATSGSPRQG